MTRFATKSETDKQDEWSSSRIKPETKSKPPRYDKRRKHYKESDPDLDMSSENKDLTRRGHLNSAICFVAMKHASVKPTPTDIRLISAQVSGDVSDPLTWPVIASVTLSHFSRTDKVAKYTRIVPTSNGFTQGEPLPVRFETLLTTDPEGYYVGDNFFDPHEFFGKPANSFIDSGTNQNEKWRQIFEFGGTLKRDSEDPYLEKFKNPSI